MARYPSITLHALLFFPNSESFTLRLNKNITTWRFSSSPTPPPYFIYTVGNAAENLEAALRAVIDADPNMHYAISRTGDYVTITAERYGRSYNESGTLLGPSHDFLPDLSLLLNNDLSVSELLTEITPALVPLNINWNTEYDCAGIGTLEIVVNNGIAPYRYEWADGYRFSTRTGMAPGLYNILVLDQIGARVNRFQTMAPPPEITAVVTVSNPTTIGGTNGTIHLAPSGGVGGPYTYEWSHLPDPITNQMIVGLGAGTYTVVIRDAAGVCPSDPIVVIVTDSDDFFATAVPTHVSCHGGSNGALDVTVSGGDEPYTYAWADGPTTKDRSGLTAGSYTLTITDAGDVSIERTFVITQPAAPLALEATIINNLCSGASIGSVSVEVSGGTPGYTYAWADGATTKDRTGLAAGNYSLTVTDDNGCTALLEVEITAPPAIVVVATVAGNNILVTVTGGTPGYTYAWADGPTTKDRLNITPGTYTLLVTDSNGCTNEAVVNVGSFTFYFSQNPIPLELTAANPDTKPNLSFINEVWVQEEYPEGDFDKIATEEHPANAAGGTVFQGETYLDAFLKAFIPEPDQSEILRADGMFLFFYYRHTEKFGTPPEPGTFTQVNTNVVLLGGLSEVAYADGTFYSAYLGTQKPFLNWETLTKTLLPTQPDYLFYLVNGFNISAINLRLKVYFDDGTHSTVTKFTKTGIQNRYEVYCIPVGLTALNLTALAAGRQVVKYEAWITDQSTNIVSEVRTYEIDYDYYPHQRFLLYLTSLGGVSTVAITGKAVRSVAMERDITENHLGHDYAVRDTGQKITWSKGMATLEFTSGYMTDAEFFARMEDFIHSEEYYLLDGDRWLPVRVEADKTPVIDERRQDALNRLEGEIFLPKSRRYTPNL